VRLEGGEEGSLSIGTILSKLSGIFFILFSTATCAARRIEDTPEIGRVRARSRTALPFLSVYTWGFTIEIRRSPARRLLCGYLHSGYPGMRVERWPAARKASHSGQCDEDWRTYPFLKNHCVDSFQFSKAALNFLNFLP
jgi:hypothetical protein